MSVTPLFATAGATNAGLYPAQGLSERLAETGQFPPLMARKLGGRRRIEGVVGLSWTRSSIGITLPC